MGSNSQPIGICQRLINFIMNKRCHPKPHDSEIKVEFRHIDGTQTDEPTVVQPNLHQRTGLVVANGKGLQEVEISDGADARGKHPRKSVTIRESEGEDETVKRKEADQATKAKNQPREATIPKPPRHWGLLSVASNINEKSAAFIRDRKKAMGRNYSLDPEKS